MPFLTYYRVNRSLDEIMSKIPNFNYFETCNKYGLYRNAAQDNTPNHFLRRCPIRTGTTLLKPFRFAYKPSETRPTNLIINGKTAFAYPITSLSGRTFGSAVITRV